MNAEEHEGSSGQRTPTDRGSHDEAGRSGSSAAAPGPERAPRGAWAWWWAYAVLVVVLLAILATAALRGRGFDLAAPALGVSLLGFTAMGVGFLRRRSAPPPVPPRAVTRATSRADPKDLRTMLREARRGRTITGPLAAASVWHRDHRFTSGDAAGMPHGLSLSLAIAANTTAQLVGGPFARPALLVILGLFVTVLLGLVVTGLVQYWTLLTHDAAPSPGEAAP